MFRQGQLAVHGLAILLGRNEAGISNRGKIFLLEPVYDVHSGMERRIAQKGTIALKKVMQV